MLAQFTQDLILINLMSNLIRFGLSIDLAFSQLLIRARLSLMIGLSCRFVEASVGERMFSRLSWLLAQALLG
jgi:hypothetical protein